MSKKIAVGIDIGTYQVKVVVAELIKSKNGYIPVIISKGLHKSKGLRHGYIINKNEVTRSVIQAVKKAEADSGHKIKIREALISVSGASLEGIRLKNTVMVSRADLEITQIDINNALLENQNNPALLNKKIIHSIPLEYKINNQKVLGNPIGMKGEKLKSETLYIACLEQHLRCLVQAVEESGIEVIDVIASPIAGSVVTLKKSQKIAGCVLANLGAETVSIVVFENDIPISLEVFPVGSADITNDIALGLQISLEEAQKIKHGIITNTVYSQHRLEELVSVRLKNIFKLIEAHLQKIGRDKLLPAGIIISGGGSGIITIKDLAQEILSLPSQIAGLNFISKQTSDNTIKDSSWAVAYGLCLMRLTSSKNSDLPAQMTNHFKNLKGKFKKWVAQFFV